MSKYSASLFNYLFNSINSIVAIVNGIIMVPVYFHYMPVSVYGSWLASGNLVAMIGLLESGFSSVITQKLASATSNNNQDEYECLAGANIVSALLFCVSILIIGFIISPFIPVIVNIENGYEHPIQMAFLLSVIASAVSVLASLVSAFPQVWQETKEVGLINAVTNLIGIGAMVITLVGGLGVIALGIGYLVRGVLNFIGQAYWIWHHWKKTDVRGVKFNMQTTVSLIKECFYPFLSRLTNVLMNNSQSLIIARFMNPALAAVYDITGKVVSCLCNFLGMANGSFFAMLSLTFAKKNRNETRKVIETIMSYFSILVAAIIVFSMLFSKTVIYYWVGLDKYGGDLLLLMIIISLCLNQYKTFYTSFLFSAGLIKKASILEIESLLVYLCVLIGIVVKIQEFAIPVSMAITATVFIFFILNQLASILNVKIMVFLRSAIANWIITIPFVTIYFLANLSCDNLLQQMLFFAISLVGFLSLSFIVDKDSYQQLYKKVILWKK